MSRLLAFTLWLVTWLPGSLCTVTTVGEFSVLEGRSLTVPCHYEAQYASYVKYWCQGRMREFCSSLARTDTPTPSGAEGRVSIFDDPVQQVFTVTMTDLKDGDTGWYWCGVEVGGVWTADAAASTHVTVNHGMFAVNNKVIGEEGSSVTVECLYSERYRESEKKWCRSGDWSSCLVTGPDGRYEDASVAITDDRIGTLAVTLRELKMRDTGWYLCAAGQQRLAMHVTVTPRPSTTSWRTSSPVPSQSTTYLQPTPMNTAKESWDSHRHILEAVLVFASLVLIVGMALLARKICEQYKRERRLGEAEELKARLNGYPGDQGDLQNATILFLNRDSQNMDGF
ncbi:polymeric immunoglobulin receptor isoform X2 [Lampris incognitus]|uniref:polymeric immunoglobulin receptor isoform X2 n=1 Tax=Lampris incognitus TaxID=2546036 RepID=UPI0024B5AF13|nr:polymeric immunoglobulin receptor isoform X2 [Lampris incognitus]